MAGHVGGGEGGGLRGERGDMPAIYGGENNKIGFFASSIFHFRDKNGIFVLSFLNCFFFL